MKEANYKNQYTFLVYLILCRYTDADHRLKQAEILQHLADDYGVITQRRSISRALAVLERLHFDLDQDSKGVALLGRVFDEGELEYILDAVFSSPSIPPKMAEQIFDHLTKTLSLEEKKRLASIEKMDAHGKAVDPHLFYEIGAIAGAIERKALIEFTYKAYSPDGRLVPLEWNPRRVYPVKAFFRDGRYCLLALTIEEPSFLRFYIDRMANVTEIPQDPEHPISCSEQAVEDYLLKHPHLGSGTVIEAEILIADERAFNSLYAFFADVEKAEQTSDGRYDVMVKADEESILSWCFALAGEVELLSPKESQEKLRERASKILGTDSGNLLPQGPAFFSPFDLLAKATSFPFSEKVATLSFPRGKVEENVNLKTFLSRQLLSFPAFQTSFSLSTAEVADFLDTLLVKNSSDSPHPLGRLFLLEALEKEKREGLLFRHGSSSYWLLKGGDNVFLSLLLLWRLCASGYQKSGKANNPAMAEFFSGKFEEYWPGSDREPSKPFAFMEAMAVASPETEGTAPSAWAEAATLADLAFRDLSLPCLKKAVETLETAYRFDLILVSAKPSQQ